MITTAALLDIAPSRAHRSCAACSHNLGRATHASSNDYAYTSKIDVLPQYRAVPIHVTLEPG